MMTGGEAAGDGMAGIGTAAVTAIVMAAIAADSLLRSFPVTMPQPKA
jgi:hypothetical protein